MFDIILFLILVPAALLLGLYLSILLVGGIVATFIPGDWTAEEGFTIFLVLMYLRRRLNGN